MTYDHPFIANHLLLKLWQKDTILSLEELKENQNFRTDLNEQCLADLQEDNLVSELSISKIKFYQITMQGKFLIEKAVKTSLENLSK